MSKLAGNAVQCKRTSKTRQLVLRSLHLREGFYFNPTLIWLVGDWMCPIMHMVWSCLMDQPLGHLEMIRCIPRTELPIYLLQKTRYFVLSNISLIDNQTAFTWMQLWVMLGPWALGFLLFILQFTKGRRGGSSLGWWRFGAVNSKTHLGNHKQLLLPSSQFIVLSCFALLRSIIPRAPCLQDKGRFALLYGS